MPHHHLSLPSFHNANISQILYKWKQEVLKILTLITIFSLYKSSFLLRCLPVSSIFFCNTTKIIKIIRITGISFIFFLLLVSSVGPSLSDPRTSQAALICNNETAAPAACLSFTSNFLAAMDAITKQKRSAYFCQINFLSERDKKKFQ